MSDGKRQRYHGLATVLNMEQIDSNAIAAGRFPEGMMVRYCPKVCGSQSNVWRRAGLIYFG